VSRAVIYEILENFVNNFVQNTQQLCEIVKILRVFFYILCAYFSNVKICKKIMPKRHDYV